MIIMRKWQTSLAPYIIPVWREEHKWTQLFDLTVIFIHMDLFAASESIVPAHLNHCQLLLPVIGPVLLLLGDKRKFRLLCENVVWINTYSVHRLNECALAVSRGKFQFVAFYSLGSINTISAWKRLYNSNAVQSLYYMDGAVSRWMCVISPSICCAMLQKDWMSSEPNFDDSLWWPAQVRE